LRENAGEENMKYIDLIIPTRNRYEKLMKCLDSVSKKTLDISISTVIICDGDKETAKKLIDDERIERMIYVRGNRGIVYCRNLVTPLQGYPLLVNLS